MSWTEIAVVIGALALTAVAFFVGMRRARNNYTHCPACGKTIFKGMLRCMHCEAINDGGDPPALVRRKDEEGRPGQ
jgi:uncharacterized OB-fold protein